MHTVAYHRRQQPAGILPQPGDDGLSLLTRRHDIRGYAAVGAHACASGGRAIGTALKLIRRGAVDYALTGGFDS
jgi:3-oxoacyl-(acyl-carrier-protein) synthase